MSEGSEARWLPIVGASAAEDGEDEFAVQYAVFFECPTCAAAVPRGSRDKHTEWHRA